MRIESDSKIVEMIRQVADLQGRDILEVGCGVGRLTAFMSKLPGRLIAIDPDVSSLREAREKLPRVDFRIGSGERLDLPGESFDLVIFARSLHHHQNGRAALTEAARVLRTGGHALVVEPVADGELEQVLMILDDETQALRRAQDAVNSCGLALVHSEIFLGRWVFDDQDDLTQSLFTYYDRGFDQKLADRLVAAVGDKAGNRPIVLLDRMTIQMLKKTTP